MMSLLMKQYVMVWAGPYLPWWVWRQICDPPHCRQPTGQAIVEYLDREACANAYHTRRSLLINEGLEVHYAPPELVEERLALYYEAMRNAREKPKPAGELLSKPSLLSSIFNKRQPKESVKGWIQGSTPLTPPALLQTG